MIKLRNYQNQEENVDRLHKSSKSIQESFCSGQVCLGSKMTFSPAPKVEVRSSNDIKIQANDFLDSYYSSLKMLNSEPHKNRWTEVEKEINDKGTYELTCEELTFGAKMAWRNSARCIGRIQWNKLKLFDARNVTSAQEMFDALCAHMKYATNGGNIRSAITVFPSRKQGQGDFKVWNSQLVTYAGYKNSDGTITGDSNNAEFTEICLKLGWKSKKTKWDILPLVLSANGNDPELFDIPSDLVLQIPITHPKYSWFTELQIQWFALPAVSGMLFDCGGVEFPAAPFNGWYMGTEIGCRNLGDTHRYNYLEEVAKKMGLDTKNPATLWKDQALVEINVAVLYSFQKYGVTIMDHHTASESFMRHMENEMKSRGGCPADWVWIVPPMSGSATPVFHQEMALYFLKPSYEYQEPAWKSHSWTNPEYISLFNESKIRDKARKYSFKSVALAVTFSTRLFYKRLLRRVKATILYATETGKSETYAKKLADMFSFGFNPEVHVMDEYDFTKLSTEKLILIVASTFGNGDPPENGEKFTTKIHDMKNYEMSCQNNLAKKSQSTFQEYSSDDEYSFSSDDILSLSDSGFSLKAASSLEFDETCTLSFYKKKALQNIGFSVFALGSTAYPNYCAFGRSMDRMFSDLGADRLLSVTCGDELGGQEETFQKWSLTVFQESCNRYSIDYDNNMANLVKLLNKENIPRNFRYTAIEQGLKDSDNELARVHNKIVCKYVLIDREELHAPNTGSQTVKVILKQTEELSKLEYNVGDHIAIFPKNRSDVCDFIISRLINKPDEDEEIEVQVQYEGDELNNIWETVTRLPRCNLREMFSTFVDVNSPVQQDMLRYLATCAENYEDEEILLRLGEEEDEYENWKHYYCPNLGTILKQFSSVKPDAMTLCYKLPLLQPRFYSVSSSPLSHPGELHLTLGVLKYQTKNGKGPWNYGVCSNYLNDIPIGTSVACFVRSAPSFHLPTDPSKPIILIGPGTGIAPFRGFWEERSYLSENNQGTNFGKTTLYFGCRNSNMILYRSELEEMINKKILSEVYVGFSREKFLIKTYVQDILKQKSQEISQNILENGAHIYVCGDCEMAEEVFQTIKAIIKKRKRLSDADVENYMRFLKEENRYHVDVFGSAHKSLATKSIHWKSDISSYIEQNALISLPVSRRGSKQITADLLHL